MKLDRAWAAVRRGHRLHVFAPSVCWPRLYVEMLDTSAEQLPFGLDLFSRLLLMCVCVLGVFLFLFVPRTVA